MGGGAHFTLSDYPGFLPGLAISVLLATAVHRYVARRLALGRPVAWLLVITFCGIIAATLTPGVETFPPVSGKASCDFSRIGPAPLADYIAMGTTGLNVLLFVPLGVAIAQLPRSRVMVLAVVGACLLPAVIEAIQLAALPLGRACQAGDVVDNMIGLTLGFAAGSTGVWISRRASKQPQHGMAPPG
jgi:VanZ like family